MKPVPTNPMLAHQRMIDAFCDDLLARDYHAPRAKAVVEITRQTREARAAEKAAGHKS